MAFTRMPVSGRQRPLTIALDDFKQGVWRLVEDSRLPENAVKEAVNMLQYQDGRWGKRPGTQTYGPDLGASIDDAFEFVKSDGTTELLALAGGTLYRLDVTAGTKSAISGGSYTAGTKTRDLQIRAQAYLTNGTDVLSYYDGTNIQTYSSLAQPTISSAATRTTLTTGSYNVYYKVVALNSVGHSVPSAATSVSGGINKPRDQWVTGESVAFSWNTVTGATRYEIYFCDDNGTFFYLDDVASGVTTYSDTGSAQPNTYTEAPVDNTTTGQKFEVMALSGNRIWATKDPNNRYRVYFGGQGSYQGAFSQFYGGGWIDLEYGGRENPTSVMHFRDGKGSSQATVLTSSPEGLGSIWQIELVSQTIGDVSFVIPNPIKIVGSIGSNAPDAVVQAGDNILFLNKKGAYSLGSRPNLLNVLSTRELSANIRPFILSLNGAAIDGTCGYYKDGRIYWSVPFGSSTSNDTTMVLDLERNNWNPQVFTIGFKKFFEHTDADGVTHFLAIPTSGTKLIEISEDLTADQGAAYSTSLLSGLYPVSKNRLEWARIVDVVFELLDPRGIITIQVLGNEKRRGFTSLATITINPNNVSTSGIGSEAFGALRFDDPAEGPAAISRSSIRKRVRVNKLMNNWQYRITTIDKNSTYTLLSVQPRGFIVPTRDPSSWRSTT